MEETVYFCSDYQLDASAHKEFNQITKNAFGASGVMNCLSALCIIYLITAKISGLATILLMALGLLYLATVLVRWYTNRDGGPLYREILRRNQGNAPRQIVSLDETGVHGANPGTQQQIFDTYESIRTLMETSNLLILVSDAKMCHIIDKRFLQGGSRDELVSFLRSRCPKLGKAIITGRFGQITQYLLWAVIALGVILAIISLL